ncbi:MULTISPECIES: leucyl/phenylalanyl-tRNA--protein transferase [unclassified Halomonas]|uniref:leucyl/phenylalanyl-tRNA--protein transferase n=1 Tax=unclassified Halomonas TaxID=2609666 RepID=UPI0028880758|nr:MULTISPECIES: leucyl/phenylalanyl-tRNA--protein transferase [unclassified Halomonas]MDT0511226.1 leucyl/phenylalanyl-tRNA--protein transferase [Halomonas sp. LES1]MDT0590485.1 leucyl/phenylalanyl-tRNA--protein transferase [Halomonas sp. PAR8]
MLPWLPPSPVHFPPVSEALDDPDGLLAAGGSLAPEWLLCAYRHGIFPWYSDDQPILWWSPDPRMVLFPDEIRVSRSLAKRVRNAGFTVTANHAFDAVIEACAAPRDGLPGTWIDDEMRAAYARLHAIGAAHSVEVWRDHSLVGGLYGVGLGPVFFGESMFSRTADASKVALVKLANAMSAGGGRLIDCQMHTRHLARLGAREIARATFIGYLEEWLGSPDSDVASPDHWMPACWSFAALDGPASDSD